ncbi:MAG: phosphoribosyltransferase [Cyanobacteria bacterium P01_G01_bin.19]
MNAVFTNRRDAGKQLARQLTAYADSSDTIVLALPRGGVPVAYEVANRLNLPLDVCLVRKIGSPYSPETAVGAIAEDALSLNNSGYIAIIDRDMIKSFEVQQPEIEAIAAQARAELRWRDYCYRHYRPMLQIKNKEVIVVDDGLATGLTMEAAIQALRQHQPQKIIIAVPVASSQAIVRLEDRVDELICLFIPNSFGAVGFWYEDFTQVSHREVCDLLSQKSIGLVGS